METETISPEVQAGAGVETPSKEETPPTAQAAVEPQTETPNQVEVKDKEPQVVEPQRIRPSDKYKERERMRRLEETNQSLARKMDEMTNFLKELKNPKPADSTVAKLTAKELLADPEKHLSAREQRFINEINALRNEFSELKNKEVVTTKSKQEREALEMLFPKASPDSNESLEDRMENSERRDFLESFFKANPALDRLMTIDPKSAAELTLLKLSQVKPPASPKAINKSLMGNMARGNPSGGAKQKTSVEDLMSELKKLSQEADSHPELRRDDAHFKRRSELIREIENLAK